MDGLIKDKPTSLCKPGLKRKDPCYVGVSDAMCSVVDIETGKIKHTFIKSYKKEQMVIRWIFYLIISLVGCGQRLGPEIFILQCRRLV